ncbi:MAG: hypothetical protein NXI04_22115 [Planctomycetaceae bacterium]|nr:hypothetical protein [Planctomycetaceae bacterium]
MRTFFNIRSLWAAAVLAGMLVIAAPTVSAGDSCHAPCYYYKTITVYKTVKKPYRYSYTKYSQCGQRYTAWATGWKTVKVPVYKRVRVSH